MTQSFPRQMLFAVLAIATCNLLWATTLVPALA
jgi:hypothetical protein